MAARAKKVRRRPNRKAHKAIRRPCPNCRHTSVIRRRNPSAHNHHGPGSFCRYHFRQPVGRKYCTRNGKRKSTVRR